MLTKTISETNIQRSIQFVISQQLCASFFSGINQFQHFCAMNFNSRHLECGKEGSGFVVNRGGREILVLIIYNLNILYLTLTVNHFFRLAF